MSENLVERLRWLAQWNEGYDPQKAFADAADRIEALKAEVERLRGALQVIIDGEYVLHDGHTTMEDWSAEDIGKIARAALSHSDKGE